MSVLLLALFACGTPDDPTPTPCVEGSCGVGSPFCGDGIVDAEEICDDGVANGRYGWCGEDCAGLAPHCGDGIVADGETCDDGVNDGAYGGCALDCGSRTAFCGDGIVDPVETCDDGVNDGSYDGCAVDCTQAGPRCGDGFTDATEVCDDGLNDGSYGGCDACAALAPFCGDGEVDSAEACDDGLNDGSYGGCRPGCEVPAPTCGDGLLDTEFGEICDFVVNDGRYGGCQADCLSLGSFCGDGVRDIEERCDDGLNDGSYLGCMPYCDEIGPHCGDGQVHAQEVCDDGENTLFLGGCFPGCQSEDETDDIFDPARFMAVDITLTPDDWQEMRTQTRDRSAMFAGEDCLDQPFGSPFTYFPGGVEIDGAPVGTVGVRKKGFLGSLNDTKPSLKLDFAEYDASNRWRGLKRMVLNNDVFDVGHMRQCITFDAFRAQGLLAPRCNYARVHVNGTDMGVFTHLEVLKKRFLRHHVGNDGGNLYEGTLSDFHPSFVTTFEQDLNEETDPSREDLAAVMEAMEILDDTIFLDRLEELFVMEELYRFWATEVATGHWDGFSGNQNNFYIYADPDQGGRFRFIAWGADYTLLQFGTRPKSISVMPTLLRKIFAIPAGRARYFQALDGVLDRWDTEALLANIDQREAVLLAHMTPAEAAALPAEIDTIRAFVGERVSSIQTALIEGEEWTTAERNNYCLIPTGTATVGIRDERWSSIELGAWEDCPTQIFDLVLDGQPVAADWLRCRSGVHTNDRHYFQMIADDTLGLNYRYTVTMLFPSGEGHLFPQQVENFTSPWYVGVSVYDLTAGAVLRNMEVTGGQLDIMEYPLVDDQPASIVLSGEMYEWDR